MVVDDEIPVDTALIVAGTGLVDGRTDEIGKVALENLSWTLVRFRWNPAIAGVMI